MFSPRLAKPQLHQIEDFLASQRELAYSYEAVGATREQPPAGYDVDRLRVQLGQGEAAFQAGCSALCQWQMFPNGWTKIYPADAEMKTGTVVAMLARCFGSWWLNACRVVYTFDESQAGTRSYGFAYGTLPAHVESGEERFSIQWDDNDQVWYELYSFSRPGSWLTRLAYPLARRQQRKFATESAAQMQNIVADQLSAQDTCSTQDTARDGLAGHALAESLG